ncbi:biotin/lipoyl-binding carrier protein [Amycolatopsis alkalitolerans]|uniref:Biotin/lipoyl-binding carrier protein n=1 Tax=Amycolatopsis alkalitolerans TaxID=2547244 RepID=A0A5C4LRI2_9PSEU|nr:biotin/lipoyl-binding carrier protein [Amycolatopsis alkalitolerans]TNC19265.1 biotin/lipoyl-binding carrier protein [Amycolatopsis alkalitolerans]
MVELRAEIVATVLKVFVEVGQDLLPGDAVVLLESMKMEIPVLAESAGRLCHLNVGEGDTVAESEVLANIE